MFKRYRKTSLQFPCQTPYKKEKVRKNCYCHDLFIYLHIKNIKDENNI